MLDFYKAHVLKRIAAYVIDLILLCAITAGVVVGMFSALDYDTYDSELKTYYAQYEEKYGVDLDLARDEIIELPEEEQKKYEDAYEALNKDDRALFLLNQTVKITLLSIAVGLLVGYLILEVMIPLILKNGQTVGKKALGLCVMHKYQVRVGVMQVIFRAIVGKYFLETLIPVMMYLLRYFGALNTTASLVLAIIVMVQAFIVFFSQANCGIHDKLFNTVVADFKKQYIFDTLDERIDYEEAYEKEMAKRESSY